MTNKNKVDLKLALKEIEHYYGDACAKRSGIPLMNHINEGIAILQSIEAIKFVQVAFALHPITQNEEDYKFKYDHSLSVLALAHSYATVANSYLCRPETDHIQNTEDLGNHLNSHIDYRVLQMLYADKIQNRKDFRLYHLGTHKRSDNLELYFNIWINYLRYRIF